MCLAAVRCSEGRQLVGRKWRRERPSTALASEGIKWNMCSGLASLSEFSWFLLKSPDFSKVSGLGSVNSDGTREVFSARREPGVEQFKSRSSRGLLPALP